MLRPLFIACSALLLPVCATAQPWTINDPRGVVEVGFVQEWFHRELEPSLYADTRWSTTSLVFTYNATSWLNFGFQGGLSEFESDDFPGSEFERYMVGVSLGARLYQRDAWSVSASTRYLDTFDLDTSPSFLHKRARTIDGSVQLVRRLDVLGQGTALHAGAIIVNDLIQTYFYDSLDAVESTSGTGFGVSAGARVVVKNWVSLYGFASYIDDLQGGVGATLHAAGGGF